MAAQDGTPLFALAFLPGGQPIYDSSKTAKHALGTQTRARDYTYGEGTFIYLKAGAAMSRGQFTTYGTVAGGFTGGPFAETTAQLLSDISAAGAPLAVVIAPSLQSGEYGWFLVSGSAPAKVDAVTSTGPVYAAGTGLQAGIVTSLMRAGQRVGGAVLLSGEVGGFADVQVNHPTVGEDR